MTGWAAAWAAVIAVWLPVYWFLVDRDPDRPRPARRTIRPACYQFVTNSVNRSRSLHGRVHGALTEWVGDRRRPSAQQRADALLQLHDDLARRVIVLERKLPLLFGLMADVTEAVGEPVVSADAAASAGRPALLLIPGGRRLAAVVVVAACARSPPRPSARSLPPGARPVRHRDHSRVGPGTLDITLPA